MSNQEQLEQEVKEYNELVQQIEGAEKERLRRLGRIELLHEQVQETEKVDEDQEQDNS